MLEIFIVKSKDGKYFQAKGYTDKELTRSWVDDIKKARIYTSVGPAKRTASWWAERYPSYGEPDVIKLTATNGEVIKADLKAITLRRLERELAGLKKQEEYWAKNPYYNIYSDEILSQIRELIAKIDKLKKT